MSNIFYCLASAYRSKSWKRESGKENEGKIPLGKERKKEKQAGGKYRELICGHSPKRSWEAMEGMKLVMESSNPDKHPKKCDLQKSSRQSGRGAVRIHKHHVSANLRQPPALFHVAPMQHAWPQGTAQKLQYNTKDPPKKKSPAPRAFHGFRMRCSDLLGSSMCEVPCFGESLQRPSLFWLSKMMVANHVKASGVKKEGSENRTYTNLNTK